MSIKVERNSTGYEVHSEDGIRGFAAAGELYVDDDGDVFIVADGADGYELIAVVEDDENLMLQPVVAWPVRKAGPGVVVTFRN